MTQNRNFQIIVVDDDEDAAKTFAELIETKLKIPVISESNPSTVLQIVRQESIKIVVLDQRMPAMSGTELYKEIKKINPYIVALMLTGEADRKEVRYAMSTLGYFDCVEKNDIQILPNKVISALAAYEVGLAKNQNTPIPLYRWNIYKNRLFSKIYEIISVEKLCENFIFDQKWKLKYELSASKEEVEDSYEYEDELIIQDSCEIKTNNLHSFTSKVLPTLKTEINSVLSNQLTATNKRRSKRTERNKRTYRLQDGVEEGKSAVKKIFEYTPIYIQFRILLRKTCRICNHIEIVPMEVYKRIPYVATRVRIYYSDGSKREINTENIAI